MLFVSVIVSNQHVSISSHFRWDCAAEEEEYLIHAAQDQHINRTCEFLISELKVLDNVDEAKKRIFFVSAKEALKMKSEDDLSYKSPLTNNRCMEWER